MAADWDPDQYHRFSRQRAQPFWDLVGLIRPAAIARAVDLGCGTGELTVAATERLSVGRMTGIDSSPAMLARAAPLAGVRVRFVAGDLATWTGDADHDLVLANASLHWVPDHGEVLARWAAALGPGGQLAVQVPANHDHPSHLACTEVSWREPFRSAFGAAGPPPDPVATNVLRPEQYAVVLHELGFDEPDVRLQVYSHVLPSTDSVVEWTKGALLTRCFDHLPEELHGPFVDAYRTELMAHLGERAPYLYLFKRILMWARRT